jgi:hypothetical protein
MCVRIGMQGLCAVAKAARRRPDTDVAKNDGQSWRLIIVWLEVRVLPAPPHSPLQTEISQSPTNSPELAGFREGPLSLLTSG